MLITPAAREMPRFITRLRSWCQDPSLSSVKFVESRTLGWAVCVTDAQEFSRLCYGKAEEDWAALFTLYGFRRLRAKDGRYYYKHADFAPWGSDSDE
jgi:hypothetical protein